MQRIWLAVLAMVLGGGAALADEVRVFVPGAMAEAFEAIARDEAGGPPAFVTVSGHSAAQAKQIAQGAPADLFVSADPLWSDDLLRRGLLVPGSVAVVAATRLVLVAPADSDWTYRFGPGDSLAAALGGGRLAIGEPDTIAAGRLARAALQRLGAWEALNGRLVLLPHVRGVLAMVGRGEAAAGIGYESELATVPGLRVVGPFPPEAAPPVLFPLAVVAGHDRPEVEAVRDRILSAASRAILRRQGFRDPP